MATVAKEGAFQGLGYYLTSPACQSYKETFFPFLEKGKGVELKERRKKRELICFLLFQEEGKEQVSEREW